VCRACQGHGDCSLSLACLPDGSCAAEADVAYVDPTGTANTLCSRPKPCSSVKSALMTSRPFVKFHGTLDETVTVQGRSEVTFLADSAAALTRAQGAGAVLTIASDVPSFKIYDLAIADVGDVNTVGISIPSGTPEVTLIRVTIKDNAGTGISIGGGALILAQSVISGNGRGGALINGDAKFTIVDNVFIGNGSMTSARGALEISTSAAATNQLEFNSFYNNAAQSGVAAAVQCTAGVFTARNNIMLDNGTLNNPLQVGGTCSHTYSIATPGPPLSGPGDLAVDPLFKDPVHGDLHLQAGSPAIRAADPSTDLTGIAARDRDGTIRTRPATLGAYQVP